VRQTLKILQLRFLRTWKVMLALAVFGTTVGVAAYRLDLFGLSGGELSAYDQALTTFTNQPWFPWGQRGRSQEIVIVAIDDSTFDGVARDEQFRRDFGSWPYTRNIWAHVLTYLADEGARVVVLDAVMDEPHTDPSGDLAMAQVISERGLPFYLGFSTRAGAPALPRVDPVNRLPAKPALAEAHQTSGEESFPVDDGFPSEEPAPAEAPELRLRRAAEALAFPVVFQELEPKKLPPEVVRDDRGNILKTLEKHPIPPIDPLLPVVPGFGLVLLEADPEDGKMRRTHFAYTDGRNVYPTLSLAVAADYFKAQQVVLSPRKLAIGDHLVPINDDGSAEIDYGGELASRFGVVSLLALLEDQRLARSGRPRVEALRGLFRDKVVIVAGFAVGTADVKATPFDPVSPGVAKHAAELDNLLRGRFITEAPFWVSLLLAFCLAFFSVMLILVVKLPIVEIGWPVLLFFSFFTVPGSVMVLTNVHILSAMPSIAGELASLAAVAFNHWFASKERDHLRQLFQSYMEKDLVEQMVESRELPRLDGVHQEVTAFFSDIRGFSTFSERYRDDPRELMRLLNVYLTRVTDVLVKHGACIDKYIGDAVVCLFNAPVRYADHAVRACRAALEVQREIGKLREEFHAQGLPDVYTRVGINTDRMLVGNIGSAQLLDFTAIGDGMNLAARLEGANKEYGTLILLGPNTHEQVKTEVEARELDWIRVAGKSEVVAVYELMAMKGELSAQKAQVVGLYAQALACFRQARFGEACQLLAKALAVDPNDGPSQTLLRRSEELLLHPPRMPFDGVSQLAK
jgi:adenylate cyclase